MVVEEEERRREMGVMPGRALCFGLRGRVYGWSGNVVWVHYSSVEKGMHDQVNQKGILPGCKNIEGKDK